MSMSGYAHTHSRHADTNVHWMADLGKTRVVIIVALRISDGASCMNLMVGGVQPAQRL